MPTLPKIYDFDETGEQYFHGNFTGGIWDFSKRQAITKITFEDTSIDRSDADITYDISDAQDGSIVAYLYDNGESNHVTITDFNTYDEVDSPTYTVYIQSKSLKIKTNIQSMGIFSSFVNLETIENIDWLNTSQATSFSLMFYGCSNLTNLNLSSFDTSNVTTMGQMFADCNKLVNLNLNNFDTSNVVNMVGMFEDCESLTSLDLSLFNTSQVTMMSYMFAGCSGLTNINLSSFDTSKVIDMESLFDGCNDLVSLDLSLFNTSQVTNMRYMFYGCSNLTNLDLNSFDTSQVTRMTRMFERCSNLTNLNIHNFNIQNVTDLFDIYVLPEDCVLDISNWSMNSLQKMFNYATTYDVKIVVKDQASFDYLAGYLYETTICVKDLEHCHNIGPV